MWRETEKEAARKMNESDSSFLCSFILGLIFKPGWGWKTYNQNDKVKLVWSFQHPGNNCIQSWIPLCCLLKITGSNYALSLSTLSQLVSWKSFQHQRPTFASTSAFGLYYIASCCWVSLMEWLAFLSLIAQTLSKTVLTTELYVMTTFTVCLLISFFFFLSAYIENLYCD